MKNEIISQLDEVLKILHDDIDFDKEKKLMDDGVFDSFDIVELITELNGRFNIKINALHITPENFNSKETMAKLVESLYG